MWQAGCHKARETLGKSPHRQLCSCVLDAGLCDVRTYSVEVGSLPFFFWRLSKPLGCWVVEWLPAEMMEGAWMSSTVSWCGLYLVLSYIRKQLSWNEMSSVQFSWLQFTSLVFRRSNLKCWCFWWGNQCSHRFNTTTAYKKLFQSLNLDLGCVQISSSLIQGQWCDLEPDLENVLAFSLWNSHWWISCREKALLLCNSTQITLRLPPMIRDCRFSNTNIE